MGDVLTSNGLMVSEDKIESITKAPRPTNKFELRSFLGLAQFCAKFVKNYSATVTSPLWELTRKETKWKWTAVEEKSFEEVKRCITTAPVMAYFKQGAKTRITTDGSPVGLGTILEQQQEDGQYKPICYASQKLDNVEQRYSQFERETLPIKWACEKFFLYLSEINFEIQMDNKPLLRVLSPKSKPPSARIERWLLYLQQFSYTLKHKAGKKNYADVLSRLPVRAEDNHSTTETEEFAHRIVSEAIPAAMTQRHIERESMGDETLQMIKEGINH